MMDEENDNLNNLLREELMKLLTRAKNLLRNVRDTEFSIGVKADLLRIEAVLVDDTRRLTFSTLHAFRDILSKGVQKIMTKLVLESYNNRPSWNTSSLGLAGPSTSSQKYSAPNAEERLALKYPRKKIGTSGAGCSRYGCSGDNSCTSSDSISRPSSPLFKRRHEVFASQPSSNTYAEHKRLSQSQQPTKPAVDSTFTINNKELVEKDTPSVNNIADSTTNSITNVNIPLTISPEYEKSKSKKNNDISNEEEHVESASANSSSISYGSHVHGEKSNHEYPNHTTIRISALPDKVKSVPSSSDNNTSNESLKGTNSKESTSTDSTTTNTTFGNSDKTQDDCKDADKSYDAEQDMLENTSINSPAHQPMDVADNVSEDISGDSSTKENGNMHKNLISKPSKLKRKGHSRELHDLLSYTTEIMPKILKGRKSSAIDVKQLNARLLKEFNITKHVVIVLEKLKPDLVAHRTRSKSIDSATCLVNDKMVNESTLESNQSTQTKTEQQKQKKSPDQKKSSNQKKSSDQNNISDRTSLDQKKSLKQKKSSDQKKLSDHKKSSQQMKSSNQTKSSNQKKTPNEKISAEKKKYIDKNKSSASKSSSSVGSKLTGQKPSSKAQADILRNELVEKKPQDATLTTVKEKDNEPIQTILKKRNRHSRSPSSSSRRKKLRLTNNAFKKVYVDDILNKSSEETDDEESRIILSSILLRKSPKPNNDPKVHCHSDYMEECCLCSYKGENMVQHYVYNHPKKAVYISRVAPEQAELIKADPFGISGDKMTRNSFRFGIQEVVKFRCYFCDLYISESQDLWIDHISGHTEEYRYKCVLCPTVARSSLERVMHHAVCSNPSIELWHKYTFENNHLYGYMCEKCNFVQVIYENMVRHLQEDHADDGTKQEHLIRFSLVNFGLKDSDTDMDCGIVKLEPILDDTAETVDEGLKRDMKLMDGEEFNSDKEDKLKIDCADEKDPLRIDAVAKLEKFQQIQLLRLEQRQEQYQLHHQQHVHEQPKLEQQQFQKLKQHQQQFQQPQPQQPQFQQPPHQQPQHQQPAPPKFQQRQEQYQLEHNQHLQKKQQFQPEQFRLHKSQQHQQLQQQLQQQLLKNQLLLKKQHLQLKEKQLQQQLINEQQLQKQQLQKLQLQEQHQQHPQLQQLQHQQSQLQQQHHQQQQLQQESVNIVAVNVEINCDIMEKQLHQQQLQHPQPHQQQLQQPQLLMPQLHQPQLEKQQLQQPHRPQQSVVAVNRDIHYESVSKNDIEDLNNSSIYTIRIKKLPGDMLSIPNKNSLAIANSNGAVSSYQPPTIRKTYKTNNFRQTPYKISTSTVAVSSPTLPNGGYIAQDKTSSSITKTSALSSLVNTDTPRILNGCNINSSVSQPLPIVNPPTTTKHISLPKPVANQSSPVLSTASQTVIMTPLKPWKGKYNAGSLSLHKLTREYLIAEFKCTVYDCGFYSDVSEEIEAHFNSHQSHSAQYAIPRHSPWLECCYCKCFSRTTSKLLEHILTTHKFCGYQCDSCCYRSRDPNNVDVHQRKYHNKRLATAKILCMPGRQKPHNYMDDDVMTNEMKTNVKCIQCAHCHMRKFIDLNDFLTHIEEHNRSHIQCHICNKYVPTQTVAEHLKLHNIFLFQCIYCDYGTTATAMIMEHVADEHLNRMLFYHTRVSRNNFPLFVRATLTIPKERFEVVRPQRPNQGISSKMLQRVNC